MSLVLVQCSAASLVLVQRRYSITRGSRHREPGVLRAIPGGFDSLAVAQHAINLCILPPFITSIVGQSAVDLVPLGFQPTLYSVEHYLIMAYVPQRRYLVTLESAVSAWYCLSTAVLPAVLPGA